MKAVIFAGGLGTRMREETDFKPKPMVSVGGKPVLWHLMKIYSSYGVEDFVILAGYKAEMIKEFFTSYSSVAADFSINLSTGQMVSYGQPPPNWKVTVLDTGPQTLTGERLLLAREFLKNEPFFCTYGDGLASIDIQSSLRTHAKGGKVATMTVTNPSSRFGLADLAPDGAVKGFREKPKLDDFVNMGFFVFEPRIFEFLRAGESLEEGGLVRLARAGQLQSYVHDGFWEPMDTYREYQRLNELWEAGEPPWKTWD